MRLPIAVAALALLTSCVTPAPPVDPNVPPDGAWVCADEQTGYLAAADPSKVIRDPQGRAELVVETKPAPANVVRASAALVSQLEARGLADVKPVTVGGLGIRSSGPHVFTGYGDTAAALSVATLPEVLRVTPNTVKRLSDPKPGTKASDGWPADRVNQRALPLDGNRQTLGDGTGIHVYVIDTGVNKGWIDGEVGEGWAYDGGDARDGHGHGSFVAGEIADKRYGIAPKAIIHPVKVLDSDGYGTDLSVYRGQEWAREHALANGWADRSVWNESLGGTTSALIDGSVCAAVAAGLVPVLAAGNDGPVGEACQGSPARVWEAITVGASDRWDDLADFSSGGPCVNIHAPGVCVDSVNGSCWNGTSMATPVVAATMALFKERGFSKADLYAAATKDALSSSRGAVNWLVYAPPPE